MSFDSRISCLGGARLGWALVALSLAGAGACAGDADGGLRLPPGTPVILVVIDTLRADPSPISRGARASRPTSCC
jgi:hypothetical protein